MAPYVCLSVCLFVRLSVCPQHNSKMNDPNVFKLSIGREYPRNDVGVERSKVKVTGSISAFFTLMTITPKLMHID